VPYDATVFFLAVAIGALSSNELAIERGHGRKESWNQSSESLSLPYLAMS
jgi:hypothetical protein